MRIDVYRLYCIKKGNHRALVSCNAHDMNQNKGGLHVRKVDSDIYRVLIFSNAAELFHMIVFIKFYMQLKRNVNHINLSKFTFIEEIN